MPLQVATSLQSIHMIESVRQILLVLVAAAVCCRMARDSCAQEFGYPRSLQFGQLLHRLPAVRRQPRATAGRFVQYPAERSPSDLESVLPGSRDDLPEYAAGRTLWWQPMVQEPLRPEAGVLFVNPHSLVLSALQHSFQIQAIQQTVHIRAEEIIKADAEFDSHAFMESKFVDTSDPVGNVLVTGGPPRLNEHDWTYEAGIRKKNRLGGTLELTQRLGHKNSNSLFFVPQDQGTAQLTLNFTQPLLNGAGRRYNESFTFLAYLGTEIARADYTAQLQDYLLQVTDVYWQLYFERAVLLQKQRHLGRAREILAQLENRLSIDAVKSQVARARSAVASRNAELVRSRTAVRNAESRLRALINSPEFSAPAMPELIPNEYPFDQLLDVKLQDALQVALTHRPEIDEAVKRIRSAAVRQDNSRNALLPSLSLVVESYVRGLRGKSGVGRAWQQQFNTGAPSYSAGLLFDVPIYNRAAQARHRQRQLEQQQLTLEFQSTLETLTTEVEIAVREVDTSYREMQAKLNAISAIVIDVRYLRERWELLPGDDRSASLVLEDILGAQERLMDEEVSFVRAQVDYARSIASLKRATGTLLDVRSVPNAGTAPGPQPVPATSFPTSLPAATGENSATRPFAAPPFTSRNVSLNRLPPVLP